MDSRDINFSFQHKTKFRFTLQSSLQGSNESYSTLGVFGGLHVASTIKLDEIVEYASKHVPWYKEKSVYQSKDLRLFPVISKSDVREHHEDFITRHWWHKWNSTEVSTSGSTGTSVQYLISSQCTATERADVNSYRNRLGYQRGDKIASFIGRKIADLSQKKPPFWRHNHIDNQLIFSYWHLSDKTASVR